MATFQVNSGHSNESTIEAARYEQVGNYFDFYDGDDNVIATLLQKNVEVILKLSAATD